MDDYGEYLDPRTLADEIRRPGQYETPREIRKRAALEADPVRRQQEEERLRALQARREWASAKEARRRKILAERAGVLRRMLEDELAPLAHAVRNGAYVDDPATDRVVRRLAQRTGIPEARLRPLVEGVLARADAGLGMSHPDLRGLVESFVEEQVGGGWVAPDGAEEELDPRALAADIPRRPVFEAAPAPNPAGGRGGR